MSEPTHKNTSRTLDTRVSEKKLKHLIIVDRGSIMFERKRGARFLISISVNFEHGVLN